MGAVSTFVRQTAKELVWTATRLLGLGHLHEEKHREALRRRLVAHHGLARLASAIWSPSCYLRYARIEERGEKVLRISFPGRIGHLSREVDVALKDAILAGDDSAKFILEDLGAGFANPALVDYFRGKVAISDDHRLFRFIDFFGDYRNRVVDTGVYEVAMYDTALGYDVYARWNDRPPLFALSPEDKAAADEYLRRAGVPADAWFVCLHAREGGYVTSDERLHSFRSIDIRSFDLAVEEIARRGGWCIRMGDASMRPHRGHPRVIDYALSEDKSPRLDIALCALCRFFLGSASGLMNVAEIFGRPCIMTNTAPLGGCYSMAPADLALPQKLRTRDGRALTFREIMADPCADFRLAEEFEARGLVNIPNSAEEIRDVVIEMFGRLDGTLIYSDEDMARQKAFRALFRKGHYAYGAASMIGREYLKANFPLDDAPSPRSGAQTT